MVVASDVGNRCLWLYDYNSLPAPYWHPLPCKPTKTPLGSPGSVITDPYATLVWVADSENDCIRKFLWTDTPPVGYPAAFLERWPSTGPILGWWDTREFRPTGDFFGVPEGVAMSEGGSRVFVADRGGLWAFEEADTANPWKRLCDFSGWGNPQPSGLACDRFGTVVYVTCYNGGILKAVEPVIPGLWPVTQVVPGS